MSFKELFKVLIVILFVGGCFLIAYYVYFIVPHEVLRYLNYTINPEVIEQVRLAVRPLLGLILIQVVITVTFFITHRSSTDLESNVIYVNKYREQTKQVTQSSEKNHVEDLQLKHQSILLQKIEQSDNLYESLIAELCKLINASAGAIFIKTVEDGQHVIELQAGYAYHHVGNQKVQYQFGEGITGQVAQNGKLIQLENIPENYIQIFSGLGQATPNCLLIMPIMGQTHEVIGVLELASFEVFSTQQIEWIEKLIAVGSKIMSKEQI